LAQLVHVYLLLLVLCLPFLASGQTHVDYLGGTEAALNGVKGGLIDMTDDQYFAFYNHDIRVRIAYNHVNELEYGQKVDRRLMMAVVLSPAFLLAKARKHFLTIGYTGDDGKQQALVFRVDKNGIRGALVGLEARTGVKVQYQDPEARKAGKG
jgi:hypothetical protein